MSMILRSLTRGFIVSSEDVRKTLCGVVFFLIVLLIFVMIAGEVVGYVYVTLGRVTFRIDKPFENMLDFFIYVVIGLSVALIPLFYGFNLRILMYSLAYLVLYIPLILLNKILVIIPTTIILISILINNKDRSFSRKVFEGLIYSIAGIEIPVLLCYLLVIVGFRYKVISSVIQFNANFLGILWISALFSIIITIALCLVPNSIKRSTISIDTSDDDKNGKVYLALGLTMSVVMGLLGYIPSINQNALPINVDWVFYYNALQRLEKSSNILIETFTPSSSWGSGDRPLYILLLYYLAKVVPIDTKVFCIYHNIALLPLYTFSTYYMTKKIFGKKPALYTALLTPASPQFISFLYGGFQANLLALSLAQIVIGTMFDRYKSWKALILVALLSIAIRLTHVYTWIQIALSTAIAMLIAVAIALTRFLRRRRVYPSNSDRKTLVFLTIFLFTGIALDLIIMQVFPKAIDVVLKQLNLLTRFAKEALGRVSIESILSRAEFNFNIYTGGSLNNPFYWILIAISSIYAEQSLATVSFIALPLLWGLGLQAVDSLYPYRVMLNIPTTALLGNIFVKIGREEKILIIITLYTIAIGKILSIVPGLFV